MKRKNIETMERALGILDGLSIILQSPASEAVACAMEMLDKILEDEKERK
jgi:hypothetical protein